MPSSLSSSTLLFIQITVPFSHTVHNVQTHLKVESSVYALDLADYALTLRARQTEDLYPLFNRPPYPSPSSFPSPLSTHHTTLWTSASRPPSLVSRPTLTSTTTHSTGTRNPRSIQRPTSLPPTLHASTVNIADQQPEIDIPGFPAWSGSWYRPPPTTPHTTTLTIQTSPHPSLHAIFTTPLVANRCSTQLRSLTSSPTPPPRTTPPANSYHGTPTHPNTTPHHSTPSSKKSATACSNANSAQTQCDQVISWTKVVNHSSGPLMRKETS
ncbi:hypothetical protein K443DRAFT_616363 [Laccaria amethystina LaAM-08-1]|uniref:Unplaced genomic scaffold K443scaffold_96, whole genome shotgun sequence n=1 Tax=Laccaria amethystina LaAM-08-1 TaxID=1095629 RepID=A0A0C9XF12_9AGAR|nr:hypothetical protein K443DRAFT_616363 [Laccaria amethystina LaAM-08-1]